jgi:hypothetical protein
LVELVDFLTVELRTAELLAWTLLLATVLAGDCFAGAAAGAFTAVRAVLATTGRRADFAGDAVAAGFEPELAAGLAAGFVVARAADRETALAVDGLANILAEDGLLDPDLVEFAVEPRAAFAGERTFFTELLFITAL